MEDAIRNFASANQLNNNTEFNHQAMVNNIVDNEIAIDNAGSYAERQEEAMQEAVNAELLTEFKENVKKWLAIDNELTRLREASKIRREKQTELFEKIADFMNKNNVGDLNTKQGLVSLKTTQVKKPLSQKEIRLRVTELLEGNDRILEEVDKIFTDREKVEKQKLTRRKA